VSGIEQADLRLGFIPLADCAPIAVAQARGLFAAEGLEVSLSREPSWANIRDKLQAGLIDAAHMLAPMALVSTVGAAGRAVPVLAPLALNSGGSAITVSAPLAAALGEIDARALQDPTAAARALARVVAMRRRRGEPALTFAAVFPYSMHAYELRYWMAAGGVDPDRDVRLVFTPPPRMAARLRSGEVDGFCVGAPWSEVSAAEGAGVILLRAGDLWPTGPDKVLGVLKPWAEARPRTLQALLRALIRAQLWADAPENREALADLLARPDYVDAPPSALARALQRSGVTFQRNAASFPWVSQAAWLLSQMARWGQLPPGVAIQAAARETYRPDLFRPAAEAVGVSAPVVDSKLEGAHDAPWALEGGLGPIAMPADRLFDGPPFDPDAAAAYVDGFEIRKLPAGGQPID
jgi:ABC-type nitrate/sulfonate/bicarbonate transport system substrate-binding protein